MPKLKLIYFEGCPNAKKAKVALEESGYQFEEVKQDDLPQTHLLKSYASPTILLDDEIIFGARTDSADGCSLEVPTSHQIRNKIEAYARDYLATLPPISRLS